MRYTIYICLSGLFMGIGSAILFPDTPWLTRGVGTTILCMGAVFFTKALED